MRNFEPNSYIIKKDYCLIELKTYKEVKYTKISLEDIEECKKYKWRFYKDKSKYYVRANYYNDHNKRCMITLHRFLLKPLKNELIDHINGDSLDNRRENLRIVDFQINALNRKISRKSSTGIKHLYITNDGHKDYYCVLFKRFGRVIFSKYLPISNETLILAQTIIKDVLQYLKTGKIISSEIKENMDKWEERNKNKGKLLVGYSKFCEEIKKLDNYTCCGCGGDFSMNPEELEVHHIITRTENPDLIKDPNNCVSLCKHCHYSIKSREKEIANLLKEIISYR